MNKEKILEIREMEKEANRCIGIKNKIEGFLEKYEDYITSFTSQDALKALESIREYAELLKCKSKTLWDKANEEVMKYKEECLHEIVFFDDRGNDLVSRTHAYYCPFCRSYIENELVKNDALVIGVQAIYNCESPWQGDVSYKVIDYMIENDLELTERNFYIAFKAIVPRYYKSWKDYYKVKVKK